MFVINADSWRGWEGAPAWWRCFVNHACRGIGSNNYDQQYRLQAISKNLGNYNGWLKLTSSNIILAVIFDSEVDYTAFRLYYSGLGTDEI